MRNIIRKAVLVILFCLIASNALASDIYQQSIMFEAIQRGDVQKIQELLTGGFDPDECIVVKETGLMLAAERGQTEIVKLFLKHGANVNKKVYDGIRQIDTSPVMFATKQAEIMKVLIAAGADITFQSRDETVLAKALAEGNTDVVKILLNAGIKLSNIYEGAMLGDITYVSQFANQSTINNYFGRDANTPLTGCVKKGNAEMTELLLKKGANPNMANRLGETPIILAVKSQDLNIVKLLAQYGADLSSRRQAMYPNQLTLESPLILAVNKPDTFKILVEFGARPVDLLEAAVIGDTESVKQFIANGADVNAGEVFTPLMAAADTGNVEVIRLLLNSGADIEKSNRLGLTPLMMAAGKGNLHAVNELIAAGAKINATSRVRNFSALAAAAANGHNEIINELVKAGAEVNQKCGTELEALSVAAYSGNLTAVKLLAALGARPSYYALYSAELQKHYEIVEYLLSTGMDVNEKDRNGATYLEHAAVMGDEEMVRLLLSHGADINARDANGVTALGHAGICGKYFLFDLLKEYGATI